MLYGGDKSMRTQSLRGWMDVLQREGTLKTVSRDVSLEFELAVLGKKADGKHTLLFNNVGKGNL